MLSRNVGLFNLIREQLSFDRLIDEFDRNLFLLPNRVDYLTYLKGLTINYKEIRVGRTVELLYLINWPHLIPSEWIQLNPHIYLQLETSVNLRTDFINDKMLKQTLVFNEPQSANIIFEVFSRNSKWENADSPANSQFCKSVDGKYSVMMMTHESEFSFMDSTTHIMLVYK